MFPHQGHTELFRTSKSKISDLVFTLEKEIPHPAPEVAMALVSQMKANIELTSRPESITKATVSSELN